MVTLHNRQLTVEVDEDLGAEIRVVRGPDGRNALAYHDWDTPTSPSRGRSYDDPELDWLADYGGGWQETVPNAGQACLVDGLPMGFHGDASRTRWEVVAATEDSVHLRCPSRLPLTIEREMRLDPDRPVLRLEGRVSNLGPADVDIVWGQHPVFPSVPGARIDLPPGGTVHHDPGRPSDLRAEDSPWPTAYAADGSAVDLTETPPAGTERLLYVAGQTDGWAAVRQPEPYVGVALAWDVAVHPFIWIWAMRDLPGFPFYGRASFLAIEAQRAWPYDGLAGARRRGQALTVPAGGSVSTWYTLALLPAGSGPVTGVARDGSVRTAG